MAGEDRYKHPSNTKGTASKVIGAAEDRAKETAGKSAMNGEGPHPDPGPSAGHDATWGEVADRHSREHKEMGERHVGEITDTHARHVDEHQKMIARHGEELKAMHSEKDIGTKGEEP